MPRHEKAMKDVVSCEKLRIGANNLRPGGLRMGQPVALKAPHPASGGKLTRGSEPSQYPEEKKANAIP